MSNPICPVIGKNGRLFDLDFSPNGVERQARQRQGTTGKCEHGRRRSLCKQCGGGSICEHGRERSACKPCGGGSICLHGRQRTSCKQCGGGSICTHGRRRSICKDCGGGSICEHGKRRTICKLPHFPLSKRQRTADKHPIAFDPSAPAWSQAVVQPMTQAMIKEPDANVPVPALQLIAMAAATAEKLEIHSTASSTVGSMPAAAPILLCAVCGQGTAAWLASQCGYIFCSSCATRVASTGYKRMTAS